MKQEAQQKYMELQVIEQQLKQSQNNLEILHQQIIELDTIANSLDEIKNAKKGEEVLVPLGSGVFIKTSLKEDNEILTNVGSDTVITKTNTEAKSFITQQMEFVTRMISKTEQELQMAISKHQELKAELEKLVEK